MLLKKNTPDQLTAKSQEYTLHDPGALGAFVSLILPQILKFRYVSFYAPMGAGKTTLIKQIAIALGVPSSVTGSPTYSIVNEYQGKQERIFHFDFYRLESIEEAYDLGLEEYFGSGAICLMEWPEIIESLMPLPYLKISIAVQVEERIVTIEEINF